MKSIIQGVKGARDFYPEQVKKRNYLLKHIHNISTSFGYEEYDGPFLEKIDLYAAKSGEELVKEQAFVFPDRGGDLITLRPELTPSLARMVAEKQNELIFPLRWWSFGPFWRYEKPQKGRTREFFQWNIDLIGISSPYADAELLNICAAFLKEVNLTPANVKIFVNHRRLMEEELSSIGISDVQKKKITKLIDRIDKIPAEGWDKLVLETGLTVQQLDGLKGIINNTNLWKKSDELVRIFEIIQAMGYGDYIQFNPRIIRGLDYYTGLVFEAWDVGGDGRAILGGGHYDNLVEDVGGEPLPGVGFAMGDVMIGLLLEKYGLWKDETQRVKVLITQFDESSSIESYKQLRLLRENNIPATVYPQASKLQKQLKYADRTGISVVLITGPDESAAGKVTIKNLSDGTQVTILQTELVQTLKGFIAQP